MSRKSPFFMFNVTVIKTKKYPYISESTVFVCLRYRGYNLHPEIRDSKNA